MSYWMITDGVIRNLTTVGQITVRQRTDYWVDCPWCDGQAMIHLYDTGRTTRLACSACGPIASDDDLPRPATEHDQEIADAYARRVRACGGAS